MLPVSVVGKAPLRVASGAAIGAGQAAITGGSAADIASGAVTGGALGGFMGEGPTPKTGAPELSHAQDLAEQVIQSKATTGDPAALGGAHANAFMEQQGVHPDTIRMAADVQKAEQTASDLDKSAGFTDNATPAAQAAQATPSPVASVEPLQNGKRVLFRGDVEQMQSQLEQNNVAPGFAKYENGKPVGIYYPAEMKDRVSQALNYAEKPNAPVQVEVPRSQDATLAPAQDAQVQGAVAEPEVGSAAGRPVQPAGDSGLGDAANNDADVTARLQDKLKDHDAAVAEYSQLPGTEGGKVINTDIARELSPEYRNDRTLSAAVHEPASAFSKKMYADKLNRPTPEGAEPTVMFTAGGTGAGKSTGLNLMGESAKKPEIIYDTNMNKFGSADEKIQQALAAGRDAHIVYTYRDPKEALVNGALPRAERMGRTVPIAEHIKTHQGAFDTIAQLQSKYRDNPNVHFTTIDNSLGKGNQRIVNGLDKLNVNKDNFHPEVLKQALDHEYQQGKISDATYRGFAGQDAVSRSGEGQRGGNRGESEQVRSGGARGGHGETAARDSGAAVGGRVAENAHAGNPQVGPHDAETALTKQWGQGAVSRLKRNGVQFMSARDVVAQKVAGHASEDSLTGVKAITPTDRARAVILNDRVAPNDVAGVVSHELVHKNMGALLGDERFQKLASAASKSLDKDVQAARANVPRGTNPEHVGEETLGYLAEQKPDHPLVQKLTDSVKLMLNRLGVPLSKLNGEGAALRKIIALNLTHAQAHEGKDTHLVQDGKELTQKPRIRVPVDQVPVNRVETPETRPVESEAKP